MKYKILADSSCDLTRELMEKLDVDLIPFNISIDDKDYIDDESLDFKEFMDNMIASKNPVKTSCPGPGDFLTSMKEYESSFVVTISSELSGAYNSAKVAEEMLKEDSSKETHVFNSQSASAGEVVLVLKLRELIDKGLSREEIIDEMNQLIKPMRTYFILESLDNLIKNGRISKTKGLIASVLNFKPIMTENGNGEIIPEETVRGTRKAFLKLVEIIGRDERDFSKLDLVISHNNALDKAEFLKEELEKKYDFRNIYIMQTKGLSSAYAYDGGVVVAF